MKFFTPIFLIALAFGLFFVFTKPRYDSAKTIAAEVSEYDEVLSKSRELKEVRDRLLTEFNSFEEADVERLNKLLPNNVENVRLIMEIDNIASQYGMTVRDVKILESVSSTDQIAEAQITNREKLDLNFTVSSSYNDFTLFLSDLENSLRIVDVGEISVKTEGSDLDFYDFTVTITTYWLTNSTNTNE